MKTTFMRSYSSQLRNIEQHRYYLALLVLISGACFWLAWPPNQWMPLLWVAFIPLLLMERHIAVYNYPRPYQTFYKYAYLTLFIWNLTTTWWIVYTTAAGVFFALFINTLYMSLPLPLFQWTTKHQGKLVGCLSLIAYWVSMEHIHLQWELSFPWLNWGNGLALFPEWAQWYAYTGALGGTIWILTANMLLCQILLEKISARKKLWGVAASLWVLIPILYSYYVYKHYKEQGEEVEVVVMQPNISPHTNAWANTGEVLTMKARLEHFIKLSETALTLQTQFLVWPESSIDAVFDESILSDYLLIEQLVEFRQRYPQLSLLLGINSLVNYPEKATQTARFSERHGYYDIFNTALFVSNQDALATYHKSKLVPGGEIIPYLYSIKLPKILLPAGLKATLRSLGKQDHPQAFFNAQGIGIAPVICYESVYGDYVAKFIHQGAHLIFAMTVDGWWGDTPGYQQHFHYTRLKAIENRKSVARSAMKGITAFINQRGDVLQATHYNDQAALRHTLQANPTITFYAQHCNYIPIAAMCNSFALVLLTLIRKMKSSQAYSKKQSDQK